MPIAYAKGNLVKHSKVEACMICGDMPCTCYAKKPTKKAAPKRQPRATEASSAPVIQRNWNKRATTGETELDFETAQAIRNLESAGLLTDVAKAKYRNVIRSVPNTQTDKQLAHWRKRNFDQA